MPVKAVIPEYFECVRGVIIKNPHVHDREAGVPFIDWEAGDGDSANGSELQGLTDVLGNL